MVKMTMMMVRMKMMMTIKEAPPPFLNPKDDDEDDDDNDKHLLHPPLEVFPPSILLCPGQRFQQLPDRHRYHHVTVTVRIIPKS